MSYATEKQSRRRFLGLLGVGAGMGGFVAGASALAGGDGPTTHELLSLTHPDTLPAPVSHGDIIVGNTTPAWARLGATVTGRVLRLVDDGGGGLNPTWIPNMLRVVRSLSGDVPVTLAGDNQAAITPVSGETTYIPNWLIEARGAANALYVVEGAIHDDLHLILETFRYQYSPTGAGDIFGVTTSLWALSGAGSTPTGFHLNFTTVTLNGGTFMVKQRFAYGWSG